MAAVDTLSHARTPACTRTHSHMHTHALSPVLCHICTTSTFFFLPTGARFGLCDGVKKCFRVQWNDYDPAKGVAYLWLTDKDREALGESVLTEPVAAPIDPSFDDDEDEREEEEPAVHHKITTIIGAPKEEIGVESLQAPRTRAHAHVHAHAHAQLVERAPVTPLRAPTPIPL
eukprot:296287-Pleurochrysis_carterae.AAC.1